MRPTLTSQQQTSRRSPLGFIKLVSILGFFILISGAAPATVEESKADKKEEKPVEMHNLDNEQLLKQAQQIFNDASAKFLAQLRGLYRMNRLFIQAQQKTEALFIPEEKFKAPSSESDADSLEVAKMKTEHAKERLDALKLCLELIQSEKKSLDLKIKQFETAWSAANNLKTAIDKLKMFQLEITLRIADGTLTPDAVPDILSELSVKTQSQHLDIQKIELKRESDTTQQELKKIVERIEKSKKAITEAEVYYSSSKEKYSQELKWKTLEKQYSGTQPEDLPALLPKLQDEHVWLKGSYKLSIRQFKKSQANADHIDREFEKMAPPEAAKVLESQTSAEAVDEEKANKIVQELADYYTQRTLQLRKLQPALKTLIKHAEIFEGDCTIFIEHLFKMQVGAKILANLASQGKIDPKIILEEYRPENLSQTSDLIFKNQSEAEASRLKALTRLALIPKQIEDSERSKKEIQDKLAIMQKTHKSALKMQKWESEIRKLTGEQIAQRFEKSAQMLNQQMLTLQKTRKEFKTGHTVYEGMYAKYELLQDPLLRVAQEESQEEKRNILVMLYEFADLELPPELAATKVEAQKEEAPKEASPDEKKETETEKKSPEKTDVQGKKDKEKAADFKIERFQNLLSNRIRVIDERLKLQTEMQKMLNSLNQQLKNYATALKEADQSAKLHHANAIELKKRIGLRQLSDDKLPDGITEALKRDMLKNLDAERAELLIHQTNIQQAIAVFSQPNEIIKKIHKILIKTLNLVGLQIDKLEEEKKLEISFEEKKTEMTSTDLKALEQTAIRRLASENTTSEYIIGLVPSERAKNLTSILQAYYQEIVELESKQENLNKQAEDINRLIKLANEEKTVIVELPSFLKKQITRFANEKEKELAIIKIRLNSAKADEILSHYETKTGTRLSLPAPIAKENKAAEIKKAANHIFDLHLRGIAIQKWIAIFEQRLGHSGISVTVNKYNDILGALTAKLNGILRRIKQLKGHSHKELVKLPPEEKPRTLLAKRRFFDGEIGVIRNDRYKANRRQAILVLTKLCSVMLIAILFHWLTNRLVNRMIERQTKLNEQNSDENALQTIVVFSLLKNFINFLIWSIAIIIGLSNLGFQVGAILAGLGIGGFAVAIAAKDTLSNLIGGMNLLITKPFKVGDSILYKGKRAEVEDISIRYTRLREEATNFLVTVPNTQLAELEVINTSDHSGWFINTRIPLSIHNTVKQANLAMKLISEIFETYPDASLKKIKLFSFDNYAFILLLRYDIHDAGKKDEVTNYVHKMVIARLQKNNIEFAGFPFLSSPNTSASPA